MTKEIIISNEFWDTSEYNYRLDSEWFALGQIDPKKYSKDSWRDVLDYERKVKMFIYKLRNDDAEENKIYDKYSGFRKYKAGYRPLNWRIAQEEAFREYGKHDINYMYDPFASPNIDNYYFDYLIADLWCDWLESFIFHVEGELANQLVLLTLEQRSFFRSIFGFKNKNTRLRRYSEIFKYIPRKNSKTFDLAALALGVMVLDGEGGCKIVACATSKEQAEYAFRPARQIILGDRAHKISNGELSNYFKTYSTAITANGDTDSFKPIAFKDSSAHGGNFHLSILDEIHEMEDDSMYNVCVTSQGARSQPLIAGITTASTAEENFCNQKLYEAKSICRQPGLDDTFLPILYYSDESEFNDDWRDIDVHKRVNPMYGIAKKETYMEKMFNKAKNNNLFENSFKRLDINMVTASTVAAFDMVNFNRCKFDMSSSNNIDIYGQSVPDFLLGAECFAGLDLAGKRDLCALTVEWPKYNWVISWSFLPEYHEKVKQWDKFRSKLNFCGTQIIDFKMLKDMIIDILDNFNCLNVGFDPRFATQLVQEVNDHYDRDDFCIQVGQSAQKANEPTRAIIDSVKGEEIIHNGCLFFTWQVGNAQAKEDNNECVLLQKTGSNSPKKIDAAAAWVNARAMSLMGEDDESLLIKRFEETGSYF